MTDRGLPIVDGAPACPFVAFEDDRDERATSPDHRHRCYAEVRPAPRALAHQEAYCLSSAFPVCPTFQDWARREAAQTRGPRGAEASTPPPPQRNPPRDWTAPPPWHERVEGLEEAPADPALGGTGLGLAGAAGAASAAGAAPAAGSTPPEPEAAAPDFLAGREAGRAAESQGLAGSPADRAASSLRPAEPASPSGAVRPSPYPDRQEDGYDDQEDAEDPDDGDDGPRSGEFARRGVGAALPLGDRRPRVGKSRPRDAEMRGPAWERPRRYEAYPTIRTRMGMPQLPRVALLAAALVVAALALFFLPALLGVGSDDRTATSPTPPASVAPSVSAEPTPTPAPTPVVYVVASGDTLSSIAARFGVTLDALIEANRETVPNPDQLAIGDELIIPVAPATPASPAGSAAPAGSATAP